MATGSVMVHIATHAYSTPDNTHNAYKSYITHNIIQRTQHRTTHILHIYTHKTYTQHKTYTHNIHYTNTYSKANTPNQQ